MDANLFPEWLVLLNALLVESEYDVATEYEARPYFNDGYPVDDAFDRIVQQRERWRRDHG